MKSPGVTDKGWAGLMAQLVSGFTLLVLCVTQFGCAPTRLERVLMKERFASEGEIQVIRIIRQGRQLTTQLGMTLKSGDEIKTDPQSSAVLSFGRETEVILRPNTHIKILSPKIFVYIGEIFTKVRGFFSVETEYATAGTGATQFLVVVGPDHKVSAIVLDGIVKLESKTKSWSPVQLTKFQQGTMQGQEAPQMRTLERDELNAIIQWVNQVGRLTKKTGYRLLLPKVVGLPEYEGKRILIGEQLTIGRIEGRITGRYPVGSIVEQRPPAGAQVSPGSRVDIIVEAEPVRVPFLLRRHIDEATNMLQEHRLSQGRVIWQITGKFPKDIVVNQEPKAGKVVPVGSAVDLWVEEESVVVPRVLGLPIEQARERLTSGRLRLGQVREDITGRSPVGMVLSQNPLPQQHVRPNTTVDLVVEAESIVVPRVVGVDVKHAVDVLEKRGLRPGNVREESRRTARPGTVVDQRPRAGERVLPGTTVDLVLEAKCVPVPNLVSAHVDQAAGFLRNAGLGWQVREDRTGRFGPGTVLSQQPRAGECVPPGTAVYLVVEARCVPVPNVVSANLNQAAGFLRNAGLGWQVREDRTGRFGPGTVLSQQPRAGECVPPGTVVYLVVEGKPILVQVPTVVGRHIDQARALIEKTGLQLGQVRRQVSRDDVIGAWGVMEQHPSPGTWVPVGTRVNLVIKSQ